ncbi:hypothetical protein F4779DRAFT_638235 [Xylariaceae sp. FL0662B]|nr:hypothetical protein F4779DRAFT_638235 [Xylariaceae sp. FL0662B]
MIIIQSRTRLGAKTDLDEAEVGHSGPYGYNAHTRVDYNQPRTSRSTDIVETYSRGYLGDMEWCVDNNGEQRGMSIYRVCQGHELFTCNSFESDDRRGCQGVNNTALNSCLATIVSGYTIAKRIESLDYISSHKLIPFKWNSFQMLQVYPSCADIAIAGLIIRGGFVYLH